MLERRHMPITKSAKKALRQNVRGKIRNLKRKNTMKELIKQTRKLASAEQKEDAVKLLPKLYQAIDKAAKRGIIKKKFEIDASKRGPEPEVKLEEKPEPPPSPKPEVPAEPEPTSSPETERPPESQPQAPPPPDVMEGKVEPMSEVPEKPDSRIGTFKPKPETKPEASGLEGEREDKKEDATSSII